jgi:hypothetical protein
MKRFLLPGMVFLLVCGGCDDPVNVCDPQVPAGQIKGQVRTGGLPVDGMISATKIPENDEGESVFMTEPDDEGFYHLDVPNGRYVVKLEIDWRRTSYDYTESGIGYGNIPPDTMLVDGSHSLENINFDLGSMALLIRLSESLNGERGEVALHRRDVDETGPRMTYLDGGRAEIAEGRLEIGMAGVMPGAYQVQVELETGEIFWMPGTRNQAESPWYEVAADSVVSLESDLAGKPARLEGEITGAWLEMGVTDIPRLFIVNLDSIPLMDSFRTEDDGSFAVDVYLPGSVKVQVVQGGIGQWIGGPDFDAATVYELQAGQTIPNVDLVQGGIHFFVDAPDEYPGSAEFRIYDPVSRDILATPFSFSPASRHVAIPNLWQGDFLIFVSPHDWMVGNTSWRPQWFDRAPEADQARTITITTAGEVVGLDLTLELGGVISGRVENEEGPSLYSRILVTPAEEFSLRAERYIYDLSGEYELRGLPDGNYRVGFLPSGQDWVDPIPPGVTWYPGTLDWETSGMVEIRDASVVTGVDFLVP